MSKSRQTPTDVRLESSCWAGSPSAMKGEYPLPSLLTPQNIRTFRGCRPVHLWGQIARNIFLLRRSFHPGELDRVVDVMRSGRIGAPAVCTAGAMLDAAIRVAICGGLIE